VKFLAEEICLKCQKNLGTFDLAEIEALSFTLVRSGHDRIAERCDMVAEFLGIIDDLGKNFFLVGLEG